MRREGIATILRNTTFIGSFYTCSIGLTIGAEVLRNLISGVGSETNLDIVEVNVVSYQIPTRLSRANYSDIVYIPVVNVIAILSIGSEADFEGRVCIGIDIYALMCPWNASLSIDIMGELIPCSSIPDFYCQFFECSCAEVIEIIIILESKARGTYSGDVWACKGLAVIGYRGAPVELCTGSGVSCTGRYTPVGTSRGSPTLSGKATAVPLFFETYQVYACCIPCGNEGKIIHSHVFGWESHFFHEHIIGLISIDIVVECP
jgi:hypothetical protein